MMQITGGSKVNRSFKLLQTVGVVVAAPSVPNLKIKIFCIRIDYADMSNEKYLS